MGQEVMVCHRWGDLEVLEVEDLLEPLLPSGHVRIAVRAAGIAFQDTWQIGGKYQTKPPFSICPTAKSAALLPRLAKATRISGLAKRSSRCCATVATPSKRRSRRGSHRVPTDTNEHDDAVLGMANDTAYQGLVDRAGLKPGEIVLVRAQEAA
ncbi:hypothetical protein B7486_63860 [cyanobacterium TDX16]|jgi:NADPH2:quinone reductase|nr:hypothetical protein B7486_63860 [cyanobacterium TDX16]